MMRINGPVVGCAGVGTLSELSINLFEIRRSELMSRSRKLPTFFGWGDKTRMQKPLHSPFADQQNTYRKDNTNSTTLSHSTHSLPSNTFKSNIRNFYSFRLGGECGFRNFQKLDLPIWLLFLSNSSCPYGK